MAGVKLRRFELGLSAQRASELIGISRQNFEKWENGSSRLTAGRLFEVAQVLNIDPGWFFQDYMQGHVPTAGSFGTTMSPAAVELVGLFNRASAENRKALRQMALACAVASSVGDDIVRDVDDEAPQAA